MDFASGFFVILTVLVCGVAAVVGDNLGKKIGKKRLSFAGLRPKHSAWLANFGMGVCLSFITLVFVLGLSAPVRSWIFRGSQAIAEAKRISKQLEQEKESLAKVQRQESDLRGQLESDRKTVGDQKGVISEQKASIQTAQSSITSLNEKISEKNETLFLNQRNLEKKEHELSQLNARLEPLKKSLDQVDKNYNQVKAEYNENLKRASKVFHDNRDLEAKNEEFRDNIDHQKKELGDLSAQKSTLEKERSALESDKATLTAELDRGKRDLGEIKSELANVTENLTRARNAEHYSEETTTYLQQDFVHTRMEPIIFSRFQEVARWTVPASLNSKQADDAIDTLMMKAQMEAATRGARAQGNFKVADIIDRPDGTTADQIKKLLHDKLVNNQDPLALIAVASFNFYKNEPIAIDVLVKPNPLIYKRGEVLQQTDLNGNASDLEIIRQLTAFGSSLRDKAQHDQMIPRSNGDPFGTVPADQVFSLVSGVKQAGRVVRLQAVVSADTRAADPLKLDFRIR